MENKELSPIDDLKITQSLLQILLSDDMNDIRIEKIKSIFESRESTFKKQIEEDKLAIEHYNETVLSLQSQLTEKDKEIEQLEIDKKYLQYRIEENIKNRQQQLAEKEEALKYCHKRMGDAYSEIHKLQSENTALKSTIFNNEANLELIQSELTSLKEYLSSSLKTVKDLNRELISVNEKRKTDVMAAYNNRHINGWVDGAHDEQEQSKTAEQYYTQTHENK